jgi:hypothetical protein
MKRNRSIRVLDLIGCLGNIYKYFVIVIFLFPLTAFANGNNDLIISIPPQESNLQVNEEAGTIENLTYKTIKEIQESNLLGNLVDINFPNKLVNCYIFHFKKGTTIYQIAAMPENDTNENLFEDIDLTLFIAIGYYGIVYSDRENYNMFRGPSYETPFDFLHGIDPKSYVSITEIEIIANINFDTVDRGGFLSPFYLYICNLENGVLSVLASPSEEKTESFYMGGWSYVPK